MLNRLSLLCLFFFRCISLAAQPAIDSIITLESLKDNITALAHDSMKGRLTTTKELYNAAVYIAAQFKEAGLKPVSGNDKYFWGYYYNAALGVTGTTANVIGGLQGDTGKLIIFSAHYDHIGTTKRGIWQGAKPGDRKDSIYNGANDNASGVAALIELAKYYSARKTNEYSVLFIAFSGEEAGMVGSATFAANINTKQVVKVINMDMLGRPAALASRKPFLVNDEHPSNRVQMNKQLYAANKEYGKNFFVEDPFPNARLNRRSDHFPFSEKGVTAFTIMTSSPDDLYYHAPGDETDTIDLPFLHNVVKAIAIACEPFLKQ